MVEGKPGKDKRGPLQDIHAEISIVLPASLILFKELHLEAFCGLSAILTVGELILTQSDVNRHG